MSVICALCMIKIPCVHLRTCGTRSSLVSSRAALRSFFRILATAMPMPRAYNFCYPMASNWGQPRSFANRCCKFLALLLDTFDKIKEEPSQTFFAVALPLRFSIRRACMLL